MQATEKEAGWGLQLDNDEKIKTLAHLLWDCESCEAFKRACHFVFTADVTITVQWKKDARSATVWLKDGSRVEASI